MVEFAVADALKGAGRCCATFGRANLSHIFQRGLVPRPQDETATVSFVRYEGSTYAVTAGHVLEIFQDLAEAEGLADESYFVPTGKGAVIQPPFVMAPQPIGMHEPDAALQKIPDGLPAHVGKEAFELQPEMNPTYPVSYAIAAGFPTAAKRNRQTPIGTQLELPCVQAVAQGLGTPSYTDQLQFRSELQSNPDIASLRGMSGGPAFWSDGNKFGLLGFIKEAHDIEPTPDEPNI